MQTVVTEPSNRCELLVQNAGRSLNSELQSMMTKVMMMLVVAVVIVLPVLDQDNAEW